MREIQNQAMTDKALKPKGLNNRELAEKIAAAIKMSPLTAKEVAERCNVTPQAVNGWKSTGRISKDMLAVFADVVKLPLGHFISSANHKKHDASPGEVIAIDHINSQKLLRLIALYAESTAAGRDFIDNAAERAEKQVRGR